MASPWTDRIFMLAGGALFGCGLSISGMVQPETVLQFLTLRDFGLVLVMGGAMGVTLLAYQLAPRLLGKPWHAGSFGSRPGTWDTSTLVGAALFGVGWGISGVCPGPAIAALGGGNLSLLWSLAGLLAGAYLHGVWVGRGAR